MYLTRHVSVSAHLNEKYIIFFVQIYLFQMCSVLMVCCQLCIPMTLSRVFSVLQKRSQELHLSMSPFLYCSGLEFANERNLYKISRQKSGRNQCSLESIADPEELPGELCALPTLKPQAQLQLLTKQPLGSTFLIVLAAPYASVPLDLPMAEWN